MACFVLLSQPGCAEHTDFSCEALLRLSRGDVVVQCTDQDDGKFITGRIVIDQTPDKVWRILSNPFEFEGKIFPRMKQVEVMVDKPEVSVLKCTVDICALFPRIWYVVESRYLQGGKIEFRRISGVPREFRGYWQVSPVDGGQRCEVAYSLYVDPGIPVPQWIVREGVKFELPRTLVALRERIQAVYEAKEAPAVRTILGAANFSLP